MLVPDRALRLKLYAHYLQDVEAPEREPLLNYLADRPVSNVREIIGIVNRLVAAADIAAMPLILPVAKMELEGGAAPPAAPEARGNGADTFFLDDEKIVWHLPDPGSLLIEDPR